MTNTASGEREQREGKRERGQSGCYWAGPVPVAGLARRAVAFSIFFDRNLSLFLFPVLKTENKNIAKLFIKICKNTF